MVTQNWFFWWPAWSQFIPDTLLYIQIEEGSFILEITHSATYLRVFYASCSTHTKHITRLESRQLQLRQTANFHILLYLSETVQMSSSFHSRIWRVNYGNPRIRKCQAENSLACRHFLLCRCKTVSWLEFVKVSQILISLNEDAEKLAVKTMYVSRRTAGCDNYDEAEIN